MLRTRKNVKYEDTNVGSHKNAGTPSFLCATDCSSPMGAPCLRAARDALQSAGVVGALDQEDGGDVGCIFNKGSLAAD